jgi:hypothetical protein
MNNLKYGANLFLYEASISSRTSYFPFSSGFLKKQCRVSNTSQYCNLYVREGVAEKFSVTQLRPLICLSN